MKLCPPYMFRSVLAAALLALAATASAQESRGSITGLVTDTQGGVLPGVSVSIVNIGTNATTTTTTNARGQFTVLYLLPATYLVNAELTGFRKIKQEVAVGVGEKIQLDLKLDPGGVVEEIEVTAAKPLLESGSATMGQTIDSKLISEIPLGDGTAYGLTRLVAGSTFERSYALQRPMDNDNLRGVTISGAINSEFTIDGSSNIASQARVAIQPPSDAIQEFKVETAVYDAQVGHTGAGSVNLALKSGTNSLHGAVSFFNRSDSRSAGLFAANARGSGVTPRDYNRFSATLSGPIIKNKTFFLLSYEKLQDDTIETVTGAVPTERMRRGDFSELLPLGVQIYDPRSARLVNGVVVRDPFPGNIIPAGRLNTVAQNILSYYPLPNQTGNADLTGNYFFEQPWTYGYDFQMARLDHNWSADHRSYLRFIHNFRREERYNWAGTQNGVDITRGGTDRFNWNAAFGHTALLSPTMFLDFRASYLRFNDDQAPADNSNSLDLASLGYPPETVALFGGYSHIPMYNIDGNAATCPATPTPASPTLCLGGNQNGFNSGRLQPFYNLQISPTLTKTMSSHTVKLGYDWRSLRQNEVNEGWKGGAYQFDSTYTRQSSTAAGRYGQGVASFLLGLPTNASFIETRSTQSYEVVGHGFFIHDDWRVNNRLTLNIGVRYDLELGMTESQNRNLRGFDFTTPNPIQAQAGLRYAASPPAGVPFSAAEFAAKIVGGYQYASEDQPRIWDADNNNIQPRFGFTYKLGNKNLLRGGVGLYVAPFQITGVPGFSNPINQFGYSRNTPVPVSSDNGLTFGADLTHPVPSGQLLAPIGSSLGLRTNLGGNTGTMFLVDRESPEYWRFSLGFERELPWGMMMEVSYLGQIGKNLPIVRNVNFVPEAFRTTSAIRNPAAETFLTQTVANPFQGLFPDNPGSNGATIARRRLLLQVPQFDQLNLESYDGSNTYHGGILRIDKRFTNGFMLSTSYTYSQFREKVAPLNPWEDLEERVGSVDRPHRITFASVAELPFGKGRKWGSDWSGFKETVLGGWQFAAKFEWQTGQPLVWNNNYFDPGCGNPKDVLKSNWGHDAAGKKYGVDLPMIDTSCFYTLNGQPFRNAAGQPVTFQATEIQLGAANIRTFPTTLPDVRFQNHHLLDLGLTKNFSLPHNMRLQIRVEALNATNYTLFNVGNIQGNSLVSTASNFGVLTNIDSSTVMKPRDIQLGARLTF